MNPSYYERPGDENIKIRVGMDPVMRSKPLFVIVAPAAACRNGLTVSATRLGNGLLVSSPMTCKKVTAVESTSVRSRQTIGKFKGDSMTIEQLKGEVSCK